jgi:hypothetical protein
VPKDFADPFYNYLVHGWEPGSCFTSVLANDFYMAMQRSHPANSVQAFKALSGWIRDTLPPQCYGSYQAVDEWCKLSSEDRRAVLENRGLVYEAKQETWMTLQGKNVVEPVWF